MRKETLAAAATVLAVLFGACHDADLGRSLGVPCAQGTPCKDAYRCALGRCRTPCAAGADCPGGACLVQGACTLPDENGCKAGGCAEGLVCGVDTVCRSACGGKEDCRGGQVCDQGACYDAAQAGSGGGGGAMGGGKPDGEACAHPGECQSDFCVEEKCCESLCDSQCYTCNVPDKPGKCLPHQPDTDPDNDCPDGYCLAGGQCSVGGTHVWSKLYSGSVDDRGLAIAVDSQDNVIIGGVFASKELDIGGVKLANANQDMQNLVSTDIFVVKLDKNGVQQWALRFGGPDDDVLTAIAVDKNDDSIVLGGHFKGTIDFGQNMIGTNGGDPSDIFLTKLDKEGTASWTNRYGDTAQTAGADEIRGLAVAKDGTIAFTGFFRETLEEPGCGGSMFNAAPGVVNNIFVVTTYPSGGCQTATAYSSGSSVGEQAGEAVAFDDSGRLYVVGHFDGKVVFHPGGNKTEIASIGASDTFVLQKNGQNDLWAATFGSPNKDRLYGVAVDPGGHVWLAGRYGGDVDFGGGARKLAERDIMLVRLRQGPNGFEWHNDYHLGGSSLAGLAAARVVVAIAPNDDVAVAGGFEKELKLSSNPAVVSTGGDDWFALRMLTTDTLVHLSAFGYGMFLDQHATGAAFDSNGNLVMVGSVLNGVNFGPGNLLEGSGGDDVAVVKLSATMTPQSQ